MLKNTSFYTNCLINLNGALMDVSIPRVVGILNITPDSFYDGGMHTSPQDTVKKAEQYLADGAEILDLGAQSTRPGAEMIGVEPEWERLVPHLRTVRRTFPEVALSIDTCWSEVARRAVIEGANMINDISAGSFDERMFDTIASLQTPYVLMHMQGTPKTMTGFTQYENVVAEVIQFFYKQLYRLDALNIKDVLIDPGFGFAKNTAQNYELMQHLDDLKILNRPIMIGVSRKKMISSVLGVETSEALNGSTALHMFALLNGARILRVHDVKEATQAVMIFKKLTEN